MWDVGASHMVNESGNINLFELRTTSTPSTGSHSSTLGMSYWPKFFYYVFNVTILTMFTDTEYALNLIWVKYYEIVVNL